MHFPNFLKPVDHGERMTTQLADAKSGRLPSRILTHQLLPNIISLLGRSIMNGWPSIHNRLVQYIRDVYIMTPVFYYETKKIEPYRSRVR